MYAIIETGGKQYRVTLGEVLSLEKLEADVGQTITFDKVLLVGGANDSTLVGTPYVSNATVAAEVVAQAKGEKILTIKYKRRKGYRRTLGHRQMLTRVLFTEVNSGSGSTAKYDESKKTEILGKASIASSKKAAKVKAASAPKAETKKTAPKATTKKAASTKKTVKKEA